MAVRRPPDWLHGQRRSIPYFPNAPAQDIEDPTWHMFVEDIWLGILPHGVEVRVEPQGNRPQGLEEIFPTRGDRFRQGLDARIADFVENAAGFLAEYGEVWYELVRPPVGIAQQPLFVLAQLPVGRITQLPSLVIQHLPRESYERVGRRYVLLRPRDLWHLILPSELGTPREHRALRRLLGGSLFPPEFPIEAMGPGASTGYDFTTHRKAHQALVAAATRRWGWTGRGMWSEESSQYFMDYRTLRFRRAQVLLRTRIINETNTLLECEGITARIIIEGLTTTEMIDAMLARHRQGTATADEVLNLLRR